MFWLNSKQPKPTMKPHRVATESTYDDESNQILQSYWVCVSGT